MGHVANIPLEGSIESTLRQAEAADLIADADFGTDETTTIAAIVTRNATAHVSMLPLIEKVKYAVRKGYAVLGATTMNADLATIYAACTETWGPGFEV